MDWERGERAWGCRNHIFFLLYIYILERKGNWAYYLGLFVENRSGYIDKFQSLFFKKLKICGSCCFSRAFQCHSLVDMAIPSVYPGYPNELSPGAFLLCFFPEKTYWEPTGTVLLKCFLGELID